MEEKDTRYEEQEGVGKKKSVTETEKEKAAQVRKSNASKLHDVMRKLIV